MTKKDWLISHSHTVFLHVDFPIFMLETSHVHFSAEQLSLDHELGIVIQEKDESTLEVHLGNYIYYLMNLHVVHLHIT